MNRTQIYIDAFNCVLLSSIDQPSLLQFYHIKDMSLFYSMNELRYQLSVFLMLEGGGHYVAKLKRMQSTRLRHV